jgi:hypothetical protein
MSCQMIGATAIKQGPLWRLIEKVHLRPPGEGVPYPARRLQLINKPPPQHLP